MQLPSDPIDVINLYHEKASRVLVDKTAKIQPRKWLQHMDKMDGAVRTLPVFRETFIMCAVIARLRAAAANKHMSNLRNTYAKTGELYKFKDFERRIDEYLAPVTFTPHGFMEQTLSSVDETQAYASIMALMKEIETFGYSCFVNSGTLLGLVRENGLLKHDDDFDLAVVLHATNDADAAEEFKILLGSLLAAGLACKFETGRNAIIKLPDIEGFQVDLFPAYASEGGFNVYPYARETLVEDDILPLKQCGKSKLPLPASPELVLEKNYGKGWKVPDPRFHFPWQIQKQAFAPFLEEMLYDA